MIRISKILFVAAIAFYCFLAAFGNITDYWANYPAVVRALTMQDIFPNATISYRAITNPVLQHVCYLTIISFESLTAILCAIGAWKLFRTRKADALIFNQEKKWAIGGLTLGFVTWQVLFMSIGGEWFGMWMSPVLNNAITTSFHIFITILVVLLYVVHKDE